MSEKFRVFIVLPELIDKRRWVDVIWRIDRVLERNIVEIIQEKPALTPESFFWLCLNSLRNNPASCLDQKHKLYKHHLIAFLSAIAIKVFQNLQSSLYEYQKGEIKSGISLIDIYQIALEVVLDPVTFFQGFDPEYNTNTLGVKKITNYAYGKIKGKIIDRLRLKNQFIGRSNLGVLVKVGQKQIKDALISRGETESTLQLYVLAVKCFLEVKNAGLINSSTNIDRDFEPVAELYLKRGKTLLTEINYSLEITSTLIKDWLNQVGKSVRDYIDIDSNTISSAVSVSRENSKSTIEDNLPDNNTILKSPLENLELVKQQEEVKNYLFKQLVALNTDGNLILFAFYGLDLNQKELAQDLAINQGTVSRRCRRIFLELINLLFQEIPKALNIEQVDNLNLTSAELKSVKDIIQILIEEYYSAWLTQKIKLSYLDKYLKNHQKVSGILNSEVTSLSQEISNYLAEKNQLVIEGKINQYLGEDKYYFWQFNFKQLITDISEERLLNFATLQPNTEELAKLVATIIELQLLIAIENYHNMAQYLRLKISEWHKHSC